MAENMRKNPWKGLNFYVEGEVIYGRNIEIQSLSQYIFNNTQTVLYGRSGIGKSSILNAGIFPKARLRGMTPVGIRLKHDDENTYLQQIRESIVRAGLTPVPLVPAVNDDGTESLWEFMHRHSFRDNEGRESVPLILLDQFEEIFTLQKNEKIKREFFHQLGDLLNDVKPAYIVESENKNRQQQISQQETMVAGSGAFKGLSLKLNIKRNDSTDGKVARYVERPEYHIVFALREDFLSSLELYAASIPVMKENRFGLLPITDEQAADIIMLPMPGLVDKNVAKLIIQKVTGRDDFALDGKPEIEVDAAILSLYLSRLFLKMPEGSDCISEALVDTYSGHIIQDFYEDSVKSDEEKGEILRPESITILEDHLLTQEGRRNNVSRSDIIHLGVSARELDILIYSRKLLRQFHHGNDIRIEYIHDILCGVVTQRIEKRELIRKQEIENARNAAERKRMILQQRRERARFRRTLRWSLAIILLLVLVWGGNYYWNEKEYSEYYRSFTRRNGWPVGVGEKLGDNAARNLVVAYRLTRKGRNPSKPFSQVDVCSPNGKVFIPDFRFPLVGNISLPGAIYDEDAKANEFAALNMKVRSIRFTGEKDLASSRTTRESYYDADGALIYSVNYYHPAEFSADAAGDSAQEGRETSSYQWAVFVDKNGLPMKVRDNGADRMKIFLSDDAQNPQKSGLESKYLFYDEQGSPQLNDVGCYGFRVVYNDDLSVDSLFYLDPFSFETMVEVLKHEPRRSESSFFSMTTGKPVAHGKLGYAKRITLYDGRGRVSERRFFDSENKRCSGNPRFGVEKVFYDRFNRTDSVCLIDPKGAVVEYRVYRYRDDDNIHSQEFRYRNVGGGRFENVYVKANIVAGNQTDNIENDLLRNFYRHERLIEDTLNKIMECTYLDKNGEITFDSIEQCCRYVRRRIDLPDNGYANVVRYYGSDGNLYRNPERPEIAAVDSSCFDSSGCRLAQVTFDADGKVLKSMGYEYKDGVEIARYALSLDGHTPIRCPEWEIDGMCYYKLNNVKNSRTEFNLAYVQAVSEYPECKSLVYFPQQGTINYEFNPVDLQLGENWIQRQQTSISIPPVPENAARVQYLHITRLDGDAYKAGLRDGDIVLENSPAGVGGRMIKVLRYDRNKNAWISSRPVRIDDRNGGMEIYPVAYTPSEYSFYLHGKRSYEK